ncbi:hypothetical protein HOC96_05130 [archaeon]|nr:hypothetical protein [archaeon]
MKVKLISSVFLMLTIALLLGSCTPVDSPEIEESIWEDAGETVEAEEELEVVQEDSEEVEEELEVAEEEESETEEVVVEESSELEEAVVEDSSSADHVIEFVSGGFEPDELSISVGDTVEFANAREGTFSQAMLIGTQSHTAIKSSMLESGESYSYTFTEADTYLFVDAILTTYLLEIVVE